ncbi:hypothetical protein QML37_30770, partial [Klebsiella pneumoniae]|uniref:hypothetical protein n=1 Tax=Klebsiella pneumoniae TaxID=573 RepID=UPI003A7F8FB7
HHHCVSSPLITLTNEQFIGRDITCHMGAVKWLLHGGEYHINLNHMDSLVRVRVRHISKNLGATVRQNYFLVFIIVLLL